jgi:hypothetical protein
MQLASVCSHEFVGSQSKMYMFPFIVPCDFGQAPLQQYCVEVFGARIPFVVSQYGPTCGHMLFAGQGVSLPMFGAASEASTLRASVLIPSPFIAASTVPSAPLSSVLSSPPW